MFFLLFLSSQNAFLQAFVHHYRDSILGGNNDFSDFSGLPGGGFHKSGNGFGGSSSTYPEWFETAKDDLSCKEVPAVVNAGRPPGDVCLAVSSI
jgi:hypothetical protein